MDEQKITGGADLHSSDNKSVQKTTVAPDGTIRRTTVGPDGTIYRTVISPDGTVRRLKKKPESSSDGSKTSGQGKSSEVGKASAVAGKMRLENQEQRQKKNEQNIRKSDNAGDVRRKKKKKKAKSRLLGILLLVGIVVFAGAAFMFFFGNRYVPTIETEDLNAYYNLDSDSQAVVIIDYEQQPEFGLIQGDTAYLEYSIVQNRLNSKIYVDLNENLLLYSMPTYTISVPMEGTGYEENGSVKEYGHPIVTTIDGKVYIALDFVQEHTNMETTAYADPNRIVITVSEEPVTEAVVKKTTEIRELGGPRSPILTAAEEGETLVVLEEGSPYTKVGTLDGIVGYIKDNKLKDKQQSDRTRDFEEPVYPNITRDHVIHMAWHQVTGEYGNTTLGDAVANTSGLNVIAPTWFFLTDTEGNVASIASAEYVQQAHAMGMEVWAVANDFDGEELFGGPNSTDGTLAVLSYTSKRNRVVQSIVQGALDAGVDGINIDFERIGEECGPHYIQFIRELSISCRNNGLVLSVDSYVPSAWSYQYHREEQNELVDYLVIMAYDEHGSWSDEIGSNSDLPYVKDAINDTLKVADAEKFILGIPFYTRIWKETPVEGSVGMNFTCDTADMWEANDFVARNALTPTWDEATGQNFVHLEYEGVTYSIWMEDAASLKLKIEAIKENQLAGWSAWKLGQETPDVWEVLNAY